MDTEEALWKILRDEYGIKSVKGLLDAIEKQDTIELSAFCLKGDCENG